MISHYQVREWNETNVRERISSQLDTFFNSDIVLLSRRYSRDKKKIAEYVFLGDILEKHFEFLKSFSGENVKINDAPGAKIVLINKEFWVPECCDKIFEKLNNNKVDALWYLFENDKKRKIVCQQCFQRYVCLRENFAKMTNLNDRSDLGRQIWCMLFEYIAWIAMANKLSHTMMSLDPINYEVIGTEDEEFFTINKNKKLFDEVVSKTTMATTERRNTPKNLRDEFTKNACGKCLFSQYFDNSKRYKECSPFENNKLDQFGGIVKRTDSIECKKYLPFDISDIANMFNYSDHKLNVLGEDSPVTRFWAMNRLMCNESFYIHPHSRRSLAFKSFDCMNEVIHLRRTIDTDDECSFTLEKYKELCADGSANNIINQYNERRKDIHKKRIGKKFGLYESLIPAFFIRFNLARDTQTSGYFGYTTNRLFDIYASSYEGEVHTSSYSQRRGGRSYPYHSHIMDYTKQFYVGADDIFNFIIEFASKMRKNTPKRVAETASKIVNIYKANETVKIERRTR